MFCHSKVFRMDLSYSDCQKCQNAEFEQTFEVSESVQPSALDLHNLRPSNAPKMHNCEFMQIFLRLGLSLKDYI